MIERSLFSEEDEICRATVRHFVEEDIVPHRAKWEEDGVAPRALWLKAGGGGPLCRPVPGKYGGPGLDYLFDVVVFEELWLGAPGRLLHWESATALSLPN